MTVTEESRHLLYERLDEVLGHEQATTLMEHLPPVGWADVSTKRDLENQMIRLKSDLDQRFTGVDRRFADVDRRFDKVDRRFDDVDRRFERVDDQFKELRGEMANHANMLRAELHRELRIQFGMLAGLGVTVIGIIVAALA